MLPLYCRRDKYRSAPEAAATAGPAGMGIVEKRERMESFPLFFSFIIYVSVSTRLETPFYRFGYVNSQNGVFTRALCDALSCLNWPGFCSIAGIAVEREFFLVDAGRNATDRRLGDAALRGISSSIGYGKTNFLNA